MVILEYTQRNQNLAQLRTEGLREGAASLQKWKTTSRGKRCNKVTLYAVRRNHKTRAMEDGASTYGRTEIPKETFVEFLLIHSQRTTNKNK